MVTPEPRGGFFPTHSQHRGFGRRHLDGPNGAQTCPSQRADASSAVTGQCAERGPCRPDQQGARPADRNESLWAPATHYERQNGVTQRT